MANHFVRGICCSALLMMSSSAVLAEGERLYADVAMTANSVKIADNRFTIPTAQARIGVWLREGIGIEVMGATGRDEDTQAGLDLEISSVQGAYLRLQSPFEGGVSGYVLLGGSQYELDGSTTTSSLPGKDEFSGGSASFGLLFALPTRVNASVITEYSRHYADDDIQFSGFSIGLRVEL